MGVSAVSAQLVWDGLDVLPGFEPAPVRAAVGPRYLVVHLPAFRVERCGWTADQVVALIAERQSAPRLVALTPAAHDAGLRLHMTTSEARTLVRDVILAPLDEAGEAADRADLVQAFEVLTDRVAAYGDDDLVLEVSGTSRLYGGEAGLLDRVRARAAELGHTCHLAIADHPVAARALARSLGQAPAGAADVCVPPGQGAEALGPLPVTALEPSDDLAQALLALGLRTIAAWARLDPAAVAGRFGDEGVTLHRVARGAPGPAWTARPAWVPLDGVRVTVDDDLEDVAAVMARLGPGLQRLRDQLASRDVLATHLELRLELVWGTSQRVRVRIARPTRDPVVLGRLLRDRLERLALEAPVHGLLVQAREVVPEGGGQQDLLARRETGEGWSELIARLGDVLGEDALLHAVPVQTWRPESAWEPHLVHADPPDPRVDDAPDDPVERQEGTQWHAARPRPTLLRHPPLPLGLRTHRGRPAALRHRGGWTPIRRARGPEQLEGQWWEPGGGYQRAYWTLETPEGTAWVFEERGQWFLHGWWD